MAKRSDRKSKGESAPPSDLAPPVETTEWLAHLWSEYQYRHDLVWKRLFTTTLVVAVLSTIPYLQANLIPQLGWLILAAPALALPVLLSAATVIGNEYALFSTVKRSYRRAMRPLVPDYPGEDDAAEGGADAIAFWKLALVLVAALWALNVAAVAFYLRGVLQGGGGP